MDNVTIVGAGISGVRTAQRLRQRGFTGEIVCLDEQAEQPYNRPPLSKSVLTGGSQLPVILTADGAAALNIEVQTGMRVLGLDVARRSIRLEGGTRDYGTLVIATGAWARTLPGLSGMTLRTWADAVRLRDSLGDAKGVVAIGAGLIGCEVAASARTLGKSVTLVDSLSQPMMRVLGQEVGRVVRALHEIHGVDVRTDVTVESANGQARLSDGTIISDVAVVVSVGAVAAVDWLAGSPVDVSNGVTCDDSGRTTAAGVFAVGDAAAWGGVRSEHWTAASHQADVVAAAILGQARPAPEAPYWWSDQYGIKIQGVGHVDGADDVTFGATAAGRLVACFSRQGILTAAVGFSAQREVMQLGSLSEAGEPVAVAWGILNPIELEDVRDVLVGCLPDASQG